MMFRRNNESAPRGIRSMGAALLLSLALLLGACSSAEDAKLSGADFNNGEGQVIYGAEDHLFNHRIEQARQGYAAALAANPSDGSAAAGKAITDCLLLPYDASVNTLLRDNLGASNGLGSARDVIYDETGYLYLLSRGVPWDDTETGELKGIKTLLASDLPWSRAKLDSSVVFADALDRPVDFLMDSLVGVAEAVEPIEAEIDVALNDADFSQFFLPGQVFHDEQLALVFGKAELAALKALLSGGRAVVYFVASYEHRWTIAAASGSQWDAVVADPTHPDHVEGWLPDDYSTRYLDPELFRSIKHVDRLAMAGEALSASIDSLIDTLDFGVASTTRSAFSWNGVDDGFVSDLRELLVSARTAVSGRSELAGSTPSTTADLSSFFSDGRVLDARTPWMERVELRDEFGTWTEWTMTDDAAEAFFVDGIFSPPFAVDQPPTFAVEDGSGTFGETLTSDVSQDFEEAYFSTR